MKYLRYLLTPTLAVVLLAGCAIPQTTTESETPLEQLPVYGEDGTCRRQTEKDEPACTDFLVVNVHTGDVTRIGKKKPILTLRHLSIGRVAVSKK